MILSLFFMFMMYMEAVHGQALSSYGQEHPWATLFFLVSIVTAGGCEMVFNIERLFKP